MAGAGERYMETLMRRRNSEKINPPQNGKTAAKSRPMKRNELDPSMLSVTLGS